MCSPGAAEHTSPGNPPKGTDQSIQEAFHQENENNSIGWQEGIKNKPICWTMVAFIKGMSVTGAGLFLATAFLKCAAIIIRSSGCWCAYSQSHSGQSDLLEKACLLFSLRLTWCFWSSQTLRTGLTQGQAAQCCCPAFLFLILVRRSWQIMPTTPKCGHADVSFLSFPGQGEDLPLPHSPSLSHCRCWAELCFSSTVQSGLVCEHLNLLFMLCRCFQGSVCVIPQAGGAVVIMSRFSGGCRADKNFLPLEFQASLQSLHPRSQGWGKLREELQCWGAVPRGAFCPFSVPWMVGLTP